MANGPKYIITTVLLLLTLFLHSQTVLDLYLSDSFKKPISFAIVTCEGSTFYSDNAGHIRLKCHHEKFDITVHKLGFADTAFTVQFKTTHPDTVTLAINLRFAPSVLPEVSITQGQLTEINPVGSEFVLGYELKDSFMVQLLAPDIIVVSNSDNVVQFRHRAKLSIRDMVKDPYGDVFVITDASAFRIIFDEPHIRLDTVSVNLTKLNWLIKYCDEVNDTCLYIRRYKDNNQTVGFFASSALHDKHIMLIKEITDIDRKNAVAAFAQETISFNEYVAGLGLSKVTATNQAELVLIRTAQNMADKLEMNYVLPAYSVLKLINDSIYLFAHDIDTMFVYDQKWNLIKRKRINYHRLKIWGRELYVNEEKTKVYTKLIENSKPVIGEIDLQSGALKPVYTSISARFPARIRVRNDVVYFMSKQKSGTGNTVYSQNLKSAP